MWFTSSYRKCLNRTALLIEVIPVEEKLEQDKKTQIEEGMRCTLIVQLWDSLINDLVYRGLAVTRKKDYQTHKTKTKTPQSSDF